jgi:hypothetical protein
MTCKSLAAIDPCYCKLVSIFIASNKSGLSPLFSRATLRIGEILSYSEAGPA